MDSPAEPEQKIHRATAKIAALERRALRLEIRIEERDGSEASIRYDRLELTAIESALLAMKWHRAAADGLVTPIDALRALVAAASEGTDDQVDVAIGRAREALAEWGRKERT